MREEDTIGEYCDDRRGHVRVKLACGVAPTDAETLRLVCLAMALHVADPVGLRLLTKPLPSQLYPVPETMPAQVDRDVREEIDELQDLMADGQDDPVWLTEVSRAIRPGIVPANKRPEEHIEQLILELFIE
jgi:hypothetical protein